MITYLVLFVLFVVIDIVSSVRLIKIRSPYMLIKNEQVCRSYFIQILSSACGAKYKKTKFEIFSAQPWYGVQPGYGPQPGYGQQAATVVVTQPMMMMPMRDVPVNMTCPSCQNQIITSTSQETGTMTWVACLVLCLIG